MSLINDALKRAKAAQQDAPPQANPGPQLRPVDTDVIVRHGAGLLLPIALTVVALLILLLVWRYAPRGGGAEPAPAVSGVLEARAKTENPGASSPSPATGAPVRSAAPDAATRSSALANSAAVDVRTPGAGSQAGVAGSTSAVVTTVADARSAAQLPPAAQPLAGAASTTVPAGTNGVSDSEAKPAKPPVPRLQGIVFNPNRPSVVINGKTLFVGDRVNGYRVLAISRDSATVVNGGQTNVLALEE